MEFISCHQLLALLGLRYLPIILVQFDHSFSLSILHFAFNISIRTQGLRPALITFYKDNKKQQPRQEYLFPVKFFTIYQRHAFYIDKIIIFAHSKRTRYRVPGTGKF
jgi:hypothetical protein